MFCLGLYECHGYRLRLGLYLHPQRIIHATLGAFAGLPSDEFDGARSLFPADKVFRPATGVQGWINQFCASIGFA
ncbi:MAG: hypothetical protein A3F68_10630 [Acidobacteria bacterium RIFCSPLOWO2_12_FULL_54_10]|nr:MAG: hypothetical protein A3F68_10630 [Acidobacteria bacterium RIFCSPLOWO2_12_FULL_54_10]